MEFKYKVTDRVVNILTNNILVITRLKRDKPAGYICKREKRPKIELLEYSLEFANAFFKKVE